MSKRKLATFESYVTEVSKAYRDPNLGWRHGQTAFNLLVWNRPDLSEQVRSKTIDPFYDDERLPEFYQWVGDNW